MRCLPSVLPIVLLVTPATASAIEPGQRIKYTTFEKQTEYLYPWLGSRVAVLTKNADLDRRVMQRMVDVLDSTYDYYARTTGKTPRRFREYEGRMSIAQVTKTCGAGCGYVGATGIEVMDDYFNNFYRRIKDDGEFDQVLFYEFGRNFWVFGSKLEYHGRDDTGSITTGFAVFMRFKAMEAAGVRGAPFGDMPFAEFRRAVESIVDEYPRKPHLNWSNTLRVGKSPAFGGGADLFASVMLHLTSRLGGEGFLQRFFREVAEMPDAKSTQDAVDNMVIAASRASGRNLVPIFESFWRWPVGTRTIDKLVERERIALATYESILNKVVGFESVNLASHFIRHAHSLGEVTRIATELDRKDASFKVVPGLANHSAPLVSLESVNHPGHYLRHEHDRIKLAKSENRDLFKQDATFRLVPGLADAKAVSFESFNYPGKYVRHYEFHLFIAALDSDLAEKDATFRVKRNLPSNEL